MSNEKLEECIESLFNSIVEEQRKESRKLIESSLKKLKESKINLSNPEKFNLHIVYKINKGIKEIANAIYNLPIKEIKNVNKLNFIYLHYDFLECHIRQLCILREGNSCCADKSRTILEIYSNYSLTGKIPEFNPNEEHYYIPKFGNYEQWISFCDSLYSLYYGHTEEYLLSYNTLIQTEIRKYKHILHTWYIKFKDGEIIKFSNSWDDDEKNPLDDECFNKGGYYILPKNRIKHRNYEIYKDKEFINNYYKVPKFDIDEIFKISEEKMI